MNFLGLFFLFIGVAYGAYNPFFDDAESPKKLTRPTALLLPPPTINLQPPPSYSEPKIPLQTQSILYFGFIETVKGKFALVKVNNENIVLKENNRVYMFNAPYFVREVNSNAIVVEDGEKRIKTIYFSGEMDRKQ